MKRTHNWSSVRKQAVLFTLLLAIGSPTYLSPAQTQKAERKVHDKTAKEMPIVIEAVNNLQKGEDEWFRDLEIVVRNVSDKPIYAIDLVIVFPKIEAPPPTPREDGTMPPRGRTGIVLSYGTPRLGDIKNLATPEDEYLKPGETYTFKVPETRVKGLKSMKDRYGLKEEDTDTIEVRINTISFGDGTGYIGRHKIAFPKKPREKALAPKAPADRLVRLKPHRFLSAEIRLTSVTL